LRRLSGSCGTRRFFVRNHVHNLPGSTEFAKE
jgi:hypothetical protein